MHGLVRSLFLLVSGAALVPLVVLLSYMASVFTAALMLP